MAQAPILMIENGPRLCSPARRGWLELVASGFSLSGLLAVLRGFVEDMPGRCYCCIYLIDPSGTKFHNAAAPNLPSSFNDPVEGAPVDRETGPCGMAACLKT